MNNKGFTLIELMVVVAIIGVIGAIAFPSYDRFMKKARRTDAMAALEIMASRQERMFVQNNAYTTLLGSVGGSGTEDNYYVLSIDSADANGFILTAAAVPGEPQATDTNTDDGDCTVLKISSTGARTPPDCW